MVTRLICLLFAGAVVAAGLAERSLVLVGLASAMVMLALRGIPEPEPSACARPWRLLVARASWSPPTFPPIALWVGGGALAGSLLAIVVASPDAFSIASTALWVVGIAAAVVLGPLLDRISAAEIRAGICRFFRSRDHRPELASVAAMTIVAFILRVYQLEAVPAMFHGDEGIVGQMGLRILAGQYPPLLAVDGEWPQAYVYTYLTALSMWLFGADVFGLRMLGVFFGAAAVPIVYGLGRVAWGPAAGAIAAWLLVVSHLQVHYSRLGTFVIQSVPLMALVLLLLALAYERGRPSAAPDGPATPPRRGVWSLMLLAGLTCGFAQYFYYGSRVIPIIAALLLLLLWRARAVTLWQAAAFGFGFVVIVAPLAAHFVEYPNRFSGRFSEVSIFQENYLREVVGPDATLPSALPALFGVQISRSLHLFVRGGDLGGFYYGNMGSFDVVTAALCWLGLGAVLSRGRRYHEASTLLWFGLGLWFSSVMTIGAHSGQRILIMTPAAFLFGGALVGRLAELARSVPAGRLDWLAAPAGTTLALWLLSANVTMYFFEYAPTGELAWQAEAAREIVRDADSSHVFFLTWPGFESKHGAIRFIARGVPITDVVTLADFRPPPPDGRKLKLIVIEQRLADLRAIAPTLPPGEERRVTSPTGRLHFIVYTVPPVR